jgi:predicted  nucleic acid-binding Zn-ribbon protein
MEIDERVAKIEGIIEQMNERLNHIETDLRDLRSDLGTLREETKSEIRELRSSLTQKIESNFKWTMGLMITMWVSIILTIIFRG